MSLQDFCHQLNQLAEEASAFRNATELEELEAARIDSAGSQNGRLKSVQKRQERFPKKKPKAEQTLNQVKTQFRRVRGSENAIGK